jgi:hypothetical protein
MRLAAGTAFLMLVLNLWVQPAAYREMRRELFEVKADLAATLVREGEFTQPAPGWPARPPPEAAANRNGRTGACSPTKNGSPGKKARPGRGPVLNQASPRPATDAGARTRLE